MTGLNNHIRRSNGNSKTVCVSHVLAAFGIATYQYNNTFNARTGKNVWGGILRRHGWAVRSRSSKMGSSTTVGSIRKKIAKLDDPSVTRYIVRVSGHILLLDRSGKTIVDTSPRKRDKRKVEGVFAIFPKKRNPNMDQVD